MQELMLMIKNPGEGQWLKHIDWNKAEFEKAIEEAVKDYQNVAYGEDQIKQAKADRAELNKLKKAIDDRRKEVKKTISAPYDEFEKEVKEVTQKLDAAVSQIDAQVKASEARQKEEKKALVLDYFREALINANQGDIDAERLCDASWLNASTSMAQIKKAIDAKVTTIQNGYAFCENLPDDERTIALMTFEKAFDIGMAISEVNLFRQKKAAEEEARKHEENQRRLAQMVPEVAQSDEEETFGDADGQSQGKNENAKEEASKGDIRGAVHEDSLSAAAKGREEAGDEMRSVKLGIVFNGEILCKIMDLMRENGIACRGSMNVQLAGTKGELLKFVEGLKESGVKYGKVS